MKNRNEKIAELKRENKSGITIKEMTHLGRVKLCLEIIDSLQAELSAIRTAKIEDKLLNKMLAHLDGVYIFSAREECDQDVTTIINSYLKAKEKLDKAVGIIKDLHPHLEAYVDNEHQFRKDYPHIQIKYDRDMEGVNVAKQFLEEMEEE